jgi:magnesium chelatase subunit D
VSGRPAYPLPALVGADDLVTALVLCALEPAIGGVLLRGEKGSAKTTAARALAAVLPGSAPFVELPLGASEDRVVGSLDLRAVLGRGEHRFQPGLLQAAHQGVLYVDEVNLLADHLVDVLLDAAVSGVNRVERDGVSHVHPARFVLVGSMNPEEGELRPQLLDRFGLSVSVRAPVGEERAEAVRRRLAFERDPEAFGARWASEEAAIRERLATARPAPLEPGLEEAVSAVCEAAGAEGLRADLVICRAAAALAGWEGRSSAGEAEVRRVAPLALAHRRRTPFGDPGTSQGAVERALDEAFGSPHRTDEPADGPGRRAGAPSRSVGDRGRPQPPAGLPGEPPVSEDVPGPTSGPPPGSAPVSPPGSAPVSPPGSAPVSPPGSAPVSPPGSTEEPAPHGGGDVAAGRLQPGLLDPLGEHRHGTGDTAGRRRHGGGPGSSAGRVVGFEKPLAAQPGRLSATGTVLAAAGRRQAGRERPGTGDRPGLEVQEEDLRQAVHHQPVTNLVVLVVDASGSMGAARRLQLARAAVLSLLVDAYQRRDRVAVVVFRGESAEVVLRPTGSTEVARARLESLPRGGRTPLAAGLSEGLAVAAGARRSAVRPLLVVVSDGRATWAAGGADPVAAALDQAAAVRRAGIEALVVDCEEGQPTLGLGAALAAAMGARLVPAAGLGGDRLADEVRSLLA